MMIRSLGLLAPLIGAADLSPAAAAAAAAAAGAEKSAVKPIMMMFTPAEITWPSLAELDGYDNTGEGLTIDSKVFTDGTVKRILVHPAATKFTLNLACGGHGQRLYVNGREVSSGDVTLKRDLARATQIVEAVCYDSSKAGSLFSPVKDHSPADKQKYLFLVQSNYNPDAIPAPGLFLNQVGIDCVVDGAHAVDGVSLAGSAAPLPVEYGPSIVCPDPKFKDSMVSVVPSGLRPDIKYTLLSGDGSVALRLLEGESTLPFKYSWSSFRIRAEAGNAVKEWSVSFGGNLMANLLYGIGCFIAITLFLLCVALVLVLGATTWMGPGVPQGSSEIASLMAAVVQYFTVSNKLRASSMLESLATPLKWMSVFWPNPIVVSSHEEGAPPPQAEGTHLLTYGGGPVFSRAYSINFSSDIDSSAIGDVNDLNNAEGCMVWCYFLVAGLAIVHFAMIAYAKAGGHEGYTVPHRLAMGNWENRALNVLLLPLAAAAAIGMFHPQATSFSQSIGAGTIACLCGWIVTVFYSVSSAVSQNEVSWVWETSVRESGVNREKDSAGYWVDTECDQLLTVPVSRAICNRLFEYKWVNTVGDIRPLLIHQTVTNTTTATNNNGQPDETNSAGRSSSSSSVGSVFSSVLRPVQKLQKGSHRTANYLMAKNPQIVHVDQGRKPCPLLNGSRLMAGVLRTKWLDIMFTFEGLTRFLDYEMADGQNTPMPLLVKTAQLSGPITSGTNSFFYDGVRIPFIRIAESMWKIAIGFTLGVAASYSLADPDSELPTLCYGAVAALSAALGVYALSTRPFLRTLDNWVFAATTGVVAASSASMMLYAYNHQSSLADLFLSITVLCACGLAVYASFVIVSIFCAVFCPPLDESKFLEKLANCSVYIATPDSPYDQQSTSSGQSAAVHRRGELRLADEYQLPAYSKYAARDIVAKSTSGRAKIHKFGTFEDLDLHFDHHEVAQACSTGVLPIP